MPYFTKKKNDSEDMKKAVNAVQKGEYSVRKAAEKYYFARYMPKKYRNPGKPERAPLVPIEIEKLPTTRARMANPQVVKTDFDDIDTI